MGKTGSWINWAIVSREDEGLKRPVNTEEDYDDGWAIRTKEAVIRSSNSSVQMRRCINFTWKSSRSQHNLKINPIFFFIACFRSHCERFIIFQRKKKFGFIFHQSIVTCSSPETTFLFWWHHFGHIGYWIMLKSWCNRSSASRSFLPYGGIHSSEIDYFGKKNVLIGWRQKLT